MRSRRVAGLRGIVLVLAVALLPAACLVEEGTYGRESFGLRYLDREEAEFLRLINEYRAANDLGALASSATINQAAYDFSVDMGERGFFDHVDPEGRTPFDRMCAGGYEPACAGSTVMGENIAAGMESAHEAFDGWRHSPGHNANMLTADYVAIGIGRAYVAGSPYGWYWTTDFGGILDEDGCACALAATRDCTTPSCGSGIQECDDHCQWNECHVPAAGTEICDGYDNDCDGATDEDVCGSCVPTTELCDGRDNDCDTVVDENRVCGPECEPVSDVEACNGNDDDCDGVVDDGCPCPVGTPDRQCGVSAGRCTLGTQSCIDGTWGPCVGAVLPQRDLCDGHDNDCDGQTDEGACNVDDGGGDDGCDCAVASSGRRRGVVGAAALLLVALAASRRRARKGGR
ncbi:MAG: CAP domain-containing protein [Deltaproteobacteria bacterium]|nr:CAP domain-containing protein [Deltaproteobacteria bacterium]